MSIEAAAVSEVVTHPGPTTPRFEAVTCSAGS